MRTMSIRKWKCNKQAKSPSSHDWSRGNWDWTFLVCSKSAAMLLRSSDYEACLSKFCYSVTHLKVSTNNRCKLWPKMVELTSRIHSTSQPSYKVQLSRVAGEILLILARGITTRSILLSTSSTHRFLLVSTLATQSRSKHCCAHLVLKSCESFSATSSSTWTYWSLPCERTKSSLTIFSATLLSLVCFVRASQSPIPSIYSKRSSMSKTWRDYLMRGGMQLSMLAQRRAPSFSTLWTERHVLATTSRKFSRSVARRSWKTAAPRPRSCSGRWELPVSCWHTIIARSLLVPSARIRWGLSCSMRPMRCVSVPSYCLNPRWSISYHPRRTVSMHLLATISMTLDRMCFSTTKSRERSRTSGLSRALRRYLEWSLSGLTSTRSTSSEVSICSTSAIMRSWMPTTSQSYRCSPRTIRSFSSVTARPSYPTVTCCRQISTTSWEGDLLTSMSATSWPTTRCWIISTTYDSSRTFSTSSSSRTSYPQAPIV